MVKQLDARGVDGASGGGPGEEVATTLTDLADVTVTNPVTGNVIRWSGAEWSNATLAVGDVSGLQAALDGKAASGHTHPIEAHTHEGYAAAQHTHPLGDLQATGTPDGTTFLRGDGTWAVPSGGAVGATSLDDLTDVDTSAVPPSIGQALVWDGTRWEPGTISTETPTSLDGLSDVDTTTAAPTDGQALVYNAATSTWEPGTISGGGGVEVGAWEENVEVVFAVPDPTEYDMTAAPVVIGTTRPVAPSFQFTVGANDVPTCADDKNFGWTPALWIAGTIAPNGTSMGVVSMELMVNGAVKVTGSDDGHTSSERTNFRSAYADPQVGDVVEIRLWASGGDGRLDYCVTYPYVQRAGFGQPPGGGRYLYQQLSMPERRTNWAPSVNVVLAPTGLYGSMDGWVDIYDEGTNESTTSWDSNGMHIRRYDVPAGGGFYRGNIGSLPYAAAFDSSNVYVRVPVTPLKFTFDRLAIPALPL